MQVGGVNVQNWSPKERPTQSSLQKFVSILLIEISQYNHLLRIKTQGRLE